MILPFSPVEFQEQDLELTKPLEVYEYFNPSCLSNGLLYSDPVDTVMSTELAFRIKYLSFLKSVGIAPI